MPHQNFIEKSHFTFVQKSFIGAGITSFVGLIALLVIWILTSQRPEACVKADEKLIIAIQKVTEKVESFVITQTNTNNQLQKRYAIDSTKEYCRRHPNECK